MGHLYKPFGTIWVDRVSRGGSGKVKICPRMAWIWLWSRPEAPKLVNDPWNGPKGVTPTARDWFEPISWPFKAFQPLYIKQNINYLIMWKLSISEIELINGQFWGAMGWDGFFPREPLASMDFRWFCYPLTITINYFFTNWPLVNNGVWKYKPKKVHDSIYLWWNMKCNIWQ